jgi:endonuclease YncB( thermonuclease family)
MAWHYKQYESEQSKEDRAQYRQTEQDAKAGKVGLWNDKNPVPPWEFRRKEK